jgi:predicted dehydrogenase
MQRGILSLTVRMQRDIVLSFPVFLFYEKGIVAMSDSRLTVAVIGLGMGRAHLDAFSKYPRSHIGAICDVNADRLHQFARQYNLPQERCFGDYRKMLRRAKPLGIQAVSIVVPNAMHAPVALESFRAGMHVLCEKPMAMNAAEARKMIQASHAARRKLMINFSFQFRDQSQALKRMADSGVLGKIYFGRTVWHRRRGMPGFGGWFGTKELSGGGPIIDLGVHRLNLAMWLMGSPNPVSVSSSIYDRIARPLAQRQKKTFNVEDLGCAMIRFDNGATLILEASWAGFSEKREDMVTHLYGDKGGIIQRNVGEGYDFEAMVYTEQNGTLWSSRMLEATQPTPSSYQEFVDAVLDDRKPCADGEEGLRVQLVLDAIYKSAATGREVRIGK